MAINFPDNPSPNAVFTDNGISWKWDGTTWEGISSTTTTTLNDIGDVNVGTTITDGHVLKWDLSSTKWVAGPDLTSSGGSGIALTDLSVLKPNPTASGSGDVTYSSTSGAFTYTPPVIPTVPTDVSAFNNDSGYLTSVGALGGLSDVDTTGAVNGKIIKYNGTSWEIGDDAGGITLTSFSVVKPNPSASGGGDVTYNASNGQFTYTPPSIPAAQVQSDWNATSGLGEILNKPTLPSNLSDLANVSSTAPNNNEVLKWNGSAWAPAADGGGGGASSADPIGTITIWSGSSSNIPTGYQLCDGSASATTELQAIRTNVPDLRDRFVIGSGSTYGENDTGGSKDAVVVEHEHTTNIDGGHVIPGNGGSSYSYGGAGTYQSTVFNMNTEGVSGTDKNLPPFWALCYIIKNAATATSGGGEANVQADWNESSSSSDAYIQNKPTLFSGNYNDLTNQPSIPGAQSQVDWSQSNSTAIDFIKNKPTDVSSFTNDAGYITSASVPSGVPSGTIVMYNSSSAPTGWVICDGSNSTPDLTDKFIIAAGSTYSVGDTGGSADAVVVSHSHGAGNFGTNNAGSHSHGQGNLSSNNTGGHTHGQGNLSTNNTGSHSHTQSGSGSGTTGTQSHNHYHTTSQNISIGGGSHSHTFAYTNYDDSNDSGLDIDTTSEGGGISNHGTSNNSHTHSFNFTADTLGVSQNHTHDFNFNIGGNTGSEGNHSHSVSGNTGTNGDHSHSISGSTGSNGGHSHTVSGNSSSQGSSGSGANLPPYYTLTFIMKT